MVLKRVFGALMVPTLLLPCVLSGGTPPPIITATAIAALEMKIKLPKGAYPLDAYNRSYAVEPVRRSKKGKFGSRRNGSSLHGAYFLHGVYELADMSAPLGRPRAKGGIRIVETGSDGLRAPLDGGCGVIEVIFDLETRYPRSVACHGEG